MISIVAMFLLRHCTSSYKVTIYKEPTHVALSYFGPVQTMITFRLKEK